MRFNIGEFFLRSKNSHCHDRNRTFVTVWEEIRKKRVKKKGQMGRAEFTPSGAPVEKKCRAANIWISRNPPLPMAAFTWHYRGRQNRFLYSVIIISIFLACYHVAKNEKNCPFVGPLFVGPLFGRTCWTCLNPPLQVGKHTIQTSKHCRAPKSKIESRAHYAPQSARGSRQDMCRNRGQRSVSSNVETNERTDGHDRLKYLSAIAVEY